MESAAAGKLVEAAKRRRKGKKGRDRPEKKADILCLRKGLKHTRLCNYGHVSDVFLNL